MPSKTASEINMSFFQKRKKNAPAHEKKLPPVGAWGHYNKKQGIKQQEKPESSEIKILIEVDKLSLSYEGRTVIENMQFTVNKGDYLCIVGENGSGKSSLMNAMLGLLKPTSGRIKLCGVARNQIGVLPQQTPVQPDFPATVQEVVLSGCLARSHKGPFLAKDSKTLAFSAMEKLGITSLASRLFRELSGGQRQRVLLARALCAAEKMLFLDEPVTGLDPASTADIYALLKSLNKEGMTIVTVTHDISAALRFGSRILHVNKDGYFIGSMEEYRTRPEAARYLEEQPETDEKIPYGEGGFRYKGAAE